MRIIETHRTRKARPDPIARPRRRPRRALAPAHALTALEARALPSVAAAVAPPDAVVPASFVGPRPYQPPAPVQAWSGPAEALVAPPDGGPPAPRGGGHPGGPGQAEGFRPGWATPVPLDRGTPGGAPARGGGRMAMAECNVVVGGLTMPEFAFDDESTGQISVIVGGVRKFSYQASPGAAAIKLADLNRDGEPDLIVADSGDPGVLVFLGQGGGAFGVGAGQFRRFATGTSPTGVTIGNVDGDRSGTLDLIIADRDSDDVTILLGQGQGPDWTMTPGPKPRLPAGSAPVRTALADVNHDGNLDLFVLNSGANDVFLYRGIGGGSFDLSNPTILPVGRSPDEMFVGRFDRRQGLDLVTVNSGSNDLTFISSVSSLQPTTMTYSSGGTQPDAAIAVDVAHDGTFDLLVANGGDGRLALLQPADIGLELAGVISRDDIPSPTAVAPGWPTPEGLDFYAATAGLDAAAILHFDLGPASAYLAVPLDEDRAINAGDDELFARLLPIGDSSLDIVAVLWNGPDVHATDAVLPRSSITAYYLKGEGQSGDESTPAVATTDPDDPNPSPQATPPDDPTSWERFVLGTEDALGRPLEAVEAVSAADAAVSPVDRASDGDPDGPDRRPSDLDARVVDEALRSLWPEGPPRAEVPATATGAIRATRGPDSAGIEDTRSEMVPVVSSSLLAARLILKASPPRPPSFRRGAPARLMRTEPVGGRPPRL